MEEKKILKALLKVIREMETTIVFYAEMGNFSEKDILVVRLATGSYQGEDLIINEAYCVNPQCDCRRVHLDLIAVSDRYAKRAIQFQLNLDTKEIDWPEGMRVPEELKAVAEEFCRDAYRTFEPVFRRHYYEAKSFGNKLHNLLNACYNFEVKAMVAYGDISPDTQPWSFSYGNKIITVIDHYCGQPECSCQDVVFTFYHVVAGKDIVDPLFAIRLKENGRFVVEEGSISHDEMNPLISAFEANVPSFRTEALSRLKEVKEFGCILAKEGISKRRIHRLLKNFPYEPQYEAPQQAETIITKKEVGRNEPCPCGSGKKYKKCCGR